MLKPQGDAKSPEHPSQNWLPFPLLPVHTDQVEVIYNKYVSRTEVCRHIFLIFSLLHDDIHLGIISVKKKVTKDR